MSNNTGIPSPTSIANYKNNDCSDKYFICRDYHFNNQRCTADNNCGGGSFLDGAVDDFNLDNSCAIIDLLGDYTIEIYPNVGIAKGRTVMDILLNVNTPATLELDGINIAGATCNNAVIVDSFFDKRFTFTCIAGPSVESTGPVVIDVNIRKTFIRLESSESFAFVIPTIEYFMPPLGPRSGGTRLVIRGRHLNIVDNVTVDIAGLLCEVQRVSESEIVCITSPIVVPEPFLINLSFDGQYQTYSEKSFAYQEDPTVQTIRPLKSFTSGGEMQTISGSNLHTIAQPMFVVSMVSNSTTRDYYTNCTVLNSTIMTCPSPELTVYTNASMSNALNNTLPDTNSQNDSDSSISKRSANDDCYQMTVDPQTCEVVEFLIGFIMDGVANCLPQNIYLYIQPEYTNMIVFKDPIFHPFTNPIYNLYSDDVYHYDPEDSSTYLVIKGERMNCGAAEEDISIQIGSDYCRMVSLYITEMTCELPKQSPPVRQEYKQSHGYPQVLVQVGVFEDNTYLIGYIHYLPPTDDINVWIIIIVVAVSILVLLAIIACLIYVWRGKKDEKKRRKRIIKSVEMNSTYTSLIIGNSWKRDPMAYVDVDLRLGVEALKIDSNRLKVHTAEVLGQGHKGLVLKGGLRCGKPGFTSSYIQDVAVKTLKDNSELEDIRRFLSEGLLMKDFSHNNVLSLIGVCIKNNGYPMIVLPYMEKGDLKTFLENPNKTFVWSQLLTYALHVAEGMEYISHMKFVHRDLAARNCMVDDMETVKVSDFGLSRDIYEKDYYSAKDKAIKLPVKWMAPESFRRKIFTSKTDVWAFGVLLWEVMTRGEIPYSGVDSWEILRYLDTGQRLSQPHYVSDDIYGIMLQCWSDDPDQRPDFSTLVIELKQLLQLFHHHNEPEQELYMEPVEDQSVQPLGEQPYYYVNYMNFL
ncbi:hepatocyte growth factor receptor-like [Glandiceps talaboti]